TEHRPNKGYSQNRCSGFDRSLQNSIVAKSWRWLTWYAHDESSRGFTRTVSASNPSKRNSPVSNPQRCSERGRSLERSGSTLALVANIDQFPESAADLEKRFETIVLRVKKSAFKR